MKIETLSQAIAEHERVVALAKAATGGEWFVSKPHRDSVAMIRSRGVLTDSDLLIAESSGGDAAFIAAAHDAVALADFWRERAGRLSHELTVIAKQSLESEIHPDLREGADYQTGYESCVRIARAALQENPR